MTLQFNPRVQELQCELLSLGLDLGKDGADGLYGKDTHEPLMTLLRERAKTIPVPSDEIEVVVESGAETHREGSGAYRLNLGGASPLVGSTIGGKPYAARQGGGYLAGCDVSHHQVVRSVDWSGQDVVIARAAYGVTPDATCGPHLDSAKQAGVPLRGAYLFVVQDRGALEQLAAFRAVLKGLPINVVPTIDLEWDSKGKMEKVDPRRLLPIAKIIRDALIDEFGQCMIYTAAGFAKGMLGMPEWLAESPLWLAHYDVPQGKPATFGVDALERWCGHQWRGAPLDASVWRSVPLLKDFHA